MMDIMKQVEIDYEYYNLAKIIETLAFRFHSFETSIHRILIFINAVNNSLKESEFSEYIINIPLDLHLIDDEIYWFYYTGYRDTISKCHDAPGIEWLNPISMTNQLAEGLPNEEEIISGLSLSKSIYILKVMLMDLLNEALLIDKDKEEFLSKYKEPANVGNKIVKYLAKREESFKSKERLLQNEDIEDEIDMIFEELSVKTPFQITKQEIENSLLPQVDNLLEIIFESPNTIEEWKRELESEKKSRVKSVESFKQFIDFVKDYDENLKKQEE